MIPWNEIGAGLAALAGGIFGTHQYKEWRGRRNGSAINHGHAWVREEATSKVLAALKQIDTSIKENGVTTNTLIKEHGESSERAIIMFTNAIAVMRQDCAVSHATLLTTIESKPPT